MKAKKKRTKLSMSEQQILGRNIIKDIVEHAIKIASFNSGHKKYQKIYENRLIKKEENYITQDYKFTGKINTSLKKDSYIWTFISKSIGKAITIEQNGEIKFYDFNTKRNKIFILNKENDENKKIISAEIYEYHQRADCRLLLLFQNFTFYTINLFILNNEGNLKNMETLMNLACSKPFNFKPYLNMQDYDEYIPDYKYIKNMIIFPKSVSDNSNDIILNFSEIAGIFLVFNFLSDSIIGNYRINHYYYEEDKDDNNNLQNIYKLIDTFVNKSWSLKQYEIASSLIDTICKNNNDSEFNKLSKILNIKDNNLEEDNLIEKINDEDNDIDIQDSVLSPVMSFNLGHITIYSILKRLKAFFDKVNDCFIAFQNNDYSLIKGKFQIYQKLFMKCFSRNIKLKEIFKYYDSENKGYVDEQIAHEIFNNLTIGFNKSELEEIFNVYNLFDENKKYMYNYLFELDEYIIAKHIYFLSFNESYKEVFSLKIEKNNELENSNLKLLVENEVSEHLISSIFNKRELTEIIYLNSTNLIFTITPHNKKIYIFKRNTKFTNNPEIIENIGYIDLDSFYKHPPMFLGYIEERNLLISQRTTKYTTELVLINVNDDLLFPFRDKKKIEFKIQNNGKNSSKDLLSFKDGNYILFQNFFYLKRNEMFALSSNNQTIYLINPKMPLYNISLKMYENKKTVYTNICKKYCENPNEQIGHLSLTIFNRINLPSKLNKILTFSFGNNNLGNEHYSKYSRTDWIIILLESNQITSYAINQVYISLRAKEIDIPLPFEEEEQIKSFAIKKMDNSFNNYINNDLNDYKCYYNMNEIKKNEIINQISLIIKDSVIHGKQFKISPKDYQFHTIFQLVKLLKDLNLHFNTNQLFEMFPIINFIPPKYEQDSEFLQYQLFPKENDDEFLNEKEVINLPKRRNQLKSDLADLETKLTIFDSGLKKIAMYILKQKKSEKKIFELIDENKEEILDDKQFISGCERIGLLSQNYLSIEELKEIFKKMDVNHNNVLTLDEFLNFLKKSDIKSILSTIRHENTLRIKNKNIFSFDIENFVLSSKEKKIEYIKPLLGEIKGFFFNYNDKELNFEEIKKNLDVITSKISREKILDKFKYGYIFMDEFKELLNNYEIELNENDINDIFAYFDQKNKNYFIYVRDIINYFNDNIEEEEIEQKEEEKKEEEEKDDKDKEKKENIQTEEKINEKKFLLIWMGILKKLIKLCKIELNLPLTDFSDKFLFIKQNRKSNVILNNIPTKLIIEKIKGKITNFLLFEETILFNIYLDYYNYGVLFKENLKLLFDYIMKYIYDFAFFDANEFDTFNSDNANTYISIEKQIMNKNKQNLEDNYIKELLPIFDIPLLEFIFHSQKKNNMENLNLLYNYLCSVGEEKDFLSQKEFIKVLKYIIPIGIYNSKAANCLFDYLSETVMLINEPKRRVVSIPKIILFIISILKRKEIMNQVINIKEIYYGDNKKILENFASSIIQIKHYNEIGDKIYDLSENYLSLTKEAIFSGLIILDKKKEIDIMKNQLVGIIKTIIYYNHYFMLVGNDLLVQKFNKRLKAINKLNKELKKLGIEDSDGDVNTKKEIEFSQIEIPTIPIDEKDSKKFINIKKYLCGMIESFDYFHPLLNCYVNIIKLRKSFLNEEISEIDGQNLLKHIEFSLKVNHYLQQEFLNKSSTIKSFENFPFLRNYGVCSKEVLINKRIEEEYYIINEKINLGNYISLYSLIKSNGGLLQIPELTNTDMAFYILRYWGKNILNILSDLFKINVCLKYFTTKDFYVSYDGKKLKMANLFTYSFCDMKGSIYSGPDILKILVLIDNIQSSQVNEYSKEQQEEIFSDAYIPPELIKSNLKLTSKTDSWVFGIILYNILFGHSPIGYYTQFKEWYELIYRNNFDKEKYDLLFLNKDYPIYFNPFSNVEEITEDKSYFFKALKLKSFSAIVKKTHLNLATENNDTTNGIGIILDMINSCLSINPRKRPLLSSLFQCDLFNFEPQELILCNKFLINVLNYYSPDNVIKEKMLIPLRGICCEIIRNEQSNPKDINNYQNFIFNVIRELNTYLFSRTFSAKAKRSESKTNLETEEDSFYEQKDDIYVKTPQCYFKNSIIVKYIIETKIVDLLIFLVLRHFDINLINFKKQFNKEVKLETNSNINNLGKIRTSSLVTEKKSNYYNEMKHNCGRLISALIDFLYNCIQAMSSYDHALTLYVENVLLWIIKLFIGEENQLLGDICDNRDSDDKLKKYIIYRTFMRDENLLFKNEFKEDELDQVFSILNANKDLCEIKSYWCPELYYFTIDLFKEAFGDKCYGNSNYIVIKNYFLTINSYTKNIANQLENPLINNKINDYLSFVGRDQQIKIKYSFINTDYVSQILSLTDMSTKLFFKTDDDNSHFKNLEDKRNALSYIHTILQNRNSYKIRGCLDFKIHFIIQKFLFTNQNNLTIRKEIFNILKEISLCLVDMNEINWMFGNNFDRVFGEIYREKTDLIDFCETYGYGKDSNWDSNFSLIDFMNKLLIQPHSFVLYFTNRFLSINMKKSVDSYITYMKEFGNMFTKPLCLTPLIKAIKNPNENFITKQLALDIIFNLMLSNEKKIIFNFNLTLCNFYELLVNTVRNCIQLPKHLQAQNDDTKSVEVNANKQFKDSVRSAIKLIIELQNPYIKTQIFSSPTMLKYMKQNNLTFKARMDINEIENKFNEINKTYLNKVEKIPSSNYDKIDSKIIFWINCFKCWIFHIGREKIYNYINNIKNVMYVIYKILNNEWTLGIKSNIKNCLVFNIIKLYEWIIKNYYHEFIFPKDDESLSLQIIISFMNKIRDNNLTMKDIIIKINKMTVAKTDKNYFTKSRKVRSQEISKEKEDPYLPNLFGNKSYTLQKVYNYITIKMFNIIYIIFSQNDPFYNRLFEKIKFGVLLSELFKIQYDTISLFLNQENIDTSILDNYMAEVRIRLGLFENMMKLPKKFDDIKSQFIENDFINYIFKNMIFDFRKFKTEYKKLTLEFLAFKTSYVLRAEALSFLNIIFKKNNNINGRTKIDCFVYDEVIRNLRVFNFVQNELLLIKKKAKGNEVLSSLGFFNMILSNNERDIIKIMNLQNASDYFVYAIQKDNSIKKLYPFIPEYINKVQKGIEAEK